MGLGAYPGVGTAILTLVLPSVKSRAKDMYIFNIATTLPHSLAPVMAGFIPGLTHGNYMFLYVAAAIFLLLGIFTVLPIKAVR